MPRFMESATGPSGWRLLRNSRQPVRRPVFLVGPSSYLFDISALACRAFRAVGVLVLVGRAAPVCLVKVRCTRRCLRLRGGGGGGGEVGGGGEGEGGGGGGGGGGVGGGGVGGEEVRGGGGGGGEGGGGVGGVERHSRVALTE
jgi:hypothetical protein